MRRSIQGLLGGGGIASDGVDEAPPVRFQHARRDLAERAVVVDPDVLEHADRDERVVLALDGAVVVLDELDLTIEPERRRARARVPDLLVGDVERPDVCAVLARHVDGERAPAAPCLDHALPGPQLELPAHMVHLGLLRFLEGGVLARVVGAGVHHFLVEPEPIEVVADIVVVVDVGLAIRGGCCGGAG